MTLKNEEKDKRSRLYLFIIIIALFLVNGILIYNLIGNEKQIAATEEKNDTLESDKIRLEAELDQMSIQLDSYRGQNEELDSIILERDREIQNKIAQLRARIKQDGISKADLEQAAMEIRALNGRVAFLKNQVDSLSKQNEYLRQDIDSKDQEIQKRQLKEDQLTSDLTAASEKVKIGSRLKVKYINAVAVKVKDEDRDREVTRLARADKIRVNFILEKNDVADHGNRVCYLKIITPSKSTLHNEERGSGKFTFKGEESLYTAKQPFVFRNQNEEITFYWDKSPAMIPGDYEAYIFCDDGIIGKTNFILK